MRYFKLWIVFFKNCLIREMGFRINFFMQILGNFFQIVISVIFFKIIYIYTPSIGGWNINQTLFLVGTNNLIDILYNSLFGKNNINISSYVRKGDLDIILLKPIDTQFFLSTRYINYSSLISIIFPFLLIFYVIFKGGFDFSIFPILIYLILIVCGLSIRYVFGFIIMLCSIWVTRLGALHSLYSEFFSLSGYPISIYKGLVRIFFTFIIPIIVISNFSVMSVFKMLNPYYVLYSLIVSIFLLIISKLFFRFSIKYYTSASS